MPPYKGQYDQFIQEASEQYGVPASHILSVIKQESAFNPNAHSPVGAQGLMQLMPDTANYLGVSNPWNPRQNIMGGTKYLAEQFKKFGTWPKAFAAYNAGPGNVRKYGGVPPFKETQGYVKNLMSMIGMIPQDQTNLLLGVGNMPGLGQGGMPNILMGQMNQGQGQGQDQSQLMELLRQQATAQPTKGQKIGDILTGLASVVAAFDKNQGAQLSNVYQQQLMNNVAARQKQKETALTKLMALQKSENPQTSNIKEYLFDAQQRASQGLPPVNLSDFLKQKSGNQGLAEQLRELQGLGFKLPFGPKPSAGSPGQQVGSPGGISSLGDDSNYIGNKPTGTSSGTNLGGANKQPKEGANFDW